GVFTKPDVPQTYLRRHYPDQVEGCSAQADLSLSAPLFSCPKSSIGAAGKMSSPPDDISARTVPFWGRMRYNGASSRARAGRPGRETRRKERRRQHEDHSTGGKYGLRAAGGTAGPGQGTRPVPVHRGLRAQDPV